MPDYDIHTLARLSRLKPRTVRLYVAEKLLPKPVFRGAKTTYGDEHLLRIKAVQHLLHGERLSFPAIRTRLAKLSLAEIDAMIPKIAAVPDLPRAELSPHPLPPRPAEPSPPADVAPVASPAPTPSAPLAAPAAMTLPDLRRAPATLPPLAERWDRIPLLPGLELHVRGNAGPVVRRIAGEIAASYAAVEVGEPTA